MLHLLSVGFCPPAIATPSPMSWYGRRSRSGGSTSGVASSSTGGAEPLGGANAAPAKPPQERPMSADEARGFGPDGNGGVEGQPYTPTSEDQVS